MSEAVGLAGVGLVRLYLEVFHLTENRIGWASWHIFTFGIGGTPILLGIYIGAS